MPAMNEDNTDMALLRALAVMAAQKTLDTYYAENTFYRATVADADWVRALFLLEVEKRIRYLRTGTEE